MFSPSTDAGRGENEKAFDTATGTVAPVVCIAYSADRNSVVYAKGTVDEGRSQTFRGGLGLPILLYQIIFLVYKDVLAWCDNVKINANSAKESAETNALGLVEDETVTLFTLFCAAVSESAPDAAMALSDHIFSTFGEGENKTLAGLRQIGKNWGVPKESIKNITGRFYEQNPQFFTAHSLLCVAKELLAFDVQNKLMQNAAVYHDHYISSDSILGGCAHISRFLRFHINDEYHAAVLVKFEDETAYIAVCGAKSTLEVDASVLEAVNRIKRPMQAFNDHWTDTSKRFLTIGADTYCGERYTKWRIRRGYDDPIQRYGDDGYLYSFKDVSPFLSDESFNVINNECVLTPVYDRPQQTGKYLDFILGGHPEKTVRCYKQANIHAVMLANNHTMDFGEIGCRQTKRYFEDAGISAIGTGKNIDDAVRPLLLKMAGRKTTEVIVFNAYCHYYEKRHRCFHHYCFGANTGAATGVLNTDDGLFYRTVSRYREQYPGALIIFSPHWSTDFNNRYTHLRPIAQKSIEAGVDVILGHGPHIALGAEYINGKLTVYSLGNFVFNTTGVDLDASGKPPYGVVAVFDFSEDAILRLYPIYTHNLNTFFRPRPVDEEHFRIFCDSFLNAKMFAEEKNDRGRCLSLNISVTSKSRDDAGG